MASTKTINLLGRYPIISDQIRADELSVLLRELDFILDKNVEGEVVELGCYEGTAALFFRRLLDTRGSDKQLFLYDSFAGLPPKTTEDLSGVGEQFKEGELKASKQKLIGNFRHAGLAIPIVKKTWFSDLVQDDLPEKIAFAFLDGDFYESILDSLRVIWPKLANGAAVLVDDYVNPALPGAAKAVDEWLRNHPFKTFKIEKSLAIIYK